MYKKMRPLSDLSLWDKNPRDMDEANKSRLKAHIQKLGMYKPLLVTSDGVVIGGNMRTKVYLELGFDNVWVSEIEVKKNDNDTYSAYIDGEKQNAEYTSELSLLTEYALSDNDRAGKYDEDKLNILLEEVDIDLSMFSVDLNYPTLLDKVSQEEVIEDEAPEPDEQSEPVSKLGEVYQLGRHRLMCGDSTSIEAVEKLMDGQKADMVFTDPPYGMNLDTEYLKNDIVRGNTYDRVIGDDKEYDPNHIFSLFPEAKEVFMWGADYYAKHLPQRGSWFVWDKKMESLDASIGSGFEICWSMNPHKKEMIRILWSGFTAKERNEARSHPTQKPIELCAWFISKFSKEGESVADLFGGSGSTLIACEQTNRTCYMMELDPKYTDVIRKRYWKFTHDNSEDGWEDGTK